MFSKLLTLFLLLLFIPGVGLAAPSLEPPPYAATGRNLAALKSEPIRIFLPTFVPDGFVLFDYELTYEGNNTTQAKNYSVLYLKDKDHWFEIESSDEVGDVDGENMRTVEAASKLFGKFQIQITNAHDPVEILQTPRFITDWLRCPDAPKDPKKWPSAYRFYHLWGFGVSPDEVIKIINSLQKVNAS